VGLLLADLSVTLCISLAELADNWGGYRLPAANNYSSSTIRFTQVAAPAVLCQALEIRSSQPLLFIMWPRQSLSIMHHAPPIGCSSPFSHLLLLLPAPACLHTEEEAPADEQAAEEGYAAEEAPAPEEGTEEGGYAVEEAPAAEDGGYAAEEAHPAEEAAEEAGYAAEEAPAAEEGAETGGYNAEEAPAGEDAAEEAGYAAEEAPAAEEGGYVAEEAGYQGDYVAPEGTIEEAAEEAAFEPETAVEAY
jgi:hypothetical protein